MKTRTTVVSLIIAILFCVQSLQAEIQHVIIKWTPALCILPSCVQGLQQQFVRISGVEDVQINQAAGQATLRWKPDVPFTFPPINTAMSMIGLSILDFRMRARGHIIQQGNNFVFVSQGDETRFVLLGPVTPQQTRYVIEFNPETHLPNPQLKDQFQQAVQNNSSVIIEGPIFQPERSPPLQLIVERFQKKDEG